MPVLSDATTCYVGTQPITKIYAGTQRVWGALGLRILQINVGGIGGPYLSAEFAEREDCADCASMKATYQVRWQISGIWTAWTPFTGYVSSQQKGYVYIGNPSDSRYQNSTFQLRTNGRVDSVVIDLSSIGPIFPIGFPTLIC